MIITDSVNEEDYSMKAEDIKNLSLWERLNLVRIDLYSDPENMTPDKINTGNGQKFISGAKLRRVTAPLFAKYGIETVYKALKPEALNPIERKGEIIRSQHFLAGCELTLINIHDPTQRETYVGYGEGSEALDKSISIAQSYAMRNVLLNAFQIVDGMEMEDVPEFALASLPNLAEDKAPLPRTEEEKDEARSKIIAKEIKDAEEIKKKVEPPKEPVKKKVELPLKKKVEIPVKKVEESPQNVPKTEEKTEEVSKPVAEETKPSVTEEAPKSAPMTILQKQAFEESKRQIQNYILEDIISVDEARTIGEFVANVKDSASFKSFQTAYKFMTQDVAKRRSKNGN